MLQKNLVSRQTIHSTYAASLVTHNGHRDLRLCLTSIAAQSKAPAECIIFDNDSIDDSLEIIHSYTPNARCIASKKNTGFAFAHNEIIRLSASDYILVLNQDLVLERDYCEKLVHFLNTHPDAGSATGKILRTHSLDILSDRLPIDACGISLSLWQHASLTHQGRKNTSCMHTHEVFGVPATCALYRRSALDDCAVDISGKREYFDEDFFMYKEDIDLAYRMRLRGWKSYCIPDARAYHVRTAKSAFLVFQRPGKGVQYWSYRNHLYLLIKNIPTALFVLLLPFIASYECAKLFYGIAFERERLAALHEVFKMIDVMREKRKSIQARRRASLRSLLYWMCIKK